MSRAERVSASGPFDGKTCFLTDEKAAQYKEEMKKIEEQDSLFLSITYGKGKITYGKGKITYGKGKITYGKGKITYGKGNNYISLAKVPGKDIWFNYKDLNNTFTIRRNGEKWELKHTVANGAIKTVQKTTIKLNITEVSGKVYFS